MNKKLLCTLLAGVTLGVSAPVFADSFRDRGYGHHRDSFHDRGYGHDRHSSHFRDYDRHDFRGHDRYAYRGYAHRPVVIERSYVVQRPVYVEQPVYYSQPQQNLGIGAMIGSAIGTIFDNRQ